MLNFPPIRAAVDGDVAEDVTKRYTVPGLKFGQVANLLLGFKTGWVATDASTLSYYPVKDNPLPTRDVTIETTADASWGIPRVTLHDDTESLISAVFPYKVLPVTGHQEEFCASSGALMVGNLDAVDVLQQLSDYLGVSLTSGFSYMLVEQTRNAGAASHTYIPGPGGGTDSHAKPEAIEKIELLNNVSRRGNLDASEAETFVDSFETLGTHYVSKVTAGDRIFQVFAYKDRAWDHVKKAFEKSAAGKAYIEGADAVSFSYYTSPRSSVTGVDLGYVSDLGKINIVSEDKAFLKTLEDGLWKDTTWANGDSIFSAYTAGSKVEVSDFKAIVPIETEFTPMGNLIPVNKTALGRKHWDQLLKGALLQKYGQVVRVTFPRENSYQWQDLLPDSGTWLSTIATPTVNAYSAHINLSEIQLTNRDAVESFSSWSLVLELGAGRTEIPGKNVSFASYVIDASGPDAPPEIVLADDESLQGLKLACGHVDGGFMVSRGDGAARKTIVDGAILDFGDIVEKTGRRGVKVVGDVLGDQDIDTLRAHEGDIDNTIVTCQALLYSRGKTAASAQNLARDCLGWVTDIIPNNDEVPPNLVTTRLRASYLANVARRLDEEGVTVPYLRYGSYRDYIQAMSSAASDLRGNIFEYQRRIDDQKNAEREAKTAQEINENIKVTGNLLKNYINAVALNQGDIAANYENIIATKQRELADSIENFAKLSQSVSDQKDAVNDARLEFEQAMVAYETTEIIKAVINISTAFVTVGIAIVTPSSTISALASLGETAQKIQKLITVLNKIMDLEKSIEGTVKDAVAVNRTLDAVKNTTLSMPTSMEWSEMSINFDASLASCPSAVAGAKAKFVAAFKVLVLRAQAMLTAQSKIAQLNAEIALNKAQKKINADQKKRLKKITDNLHYGDVSKAPNVSEIDLLSLTGQVQSQLNQVLSSLAQALVLQDSAVQFELLAEPVSISRFDLSSLLLTMTRQQANIIAAKQAFNPPPFIVNDPIEVAVKGVPISLLRDGNVYQFQIQSSVSEFQPYNMVRIQQVTVDIPQVEGSKNGKYRIDLSYLGDPFVDRDPSGEELVFNTNTRHFGPYEYNAKDHSPVFGDQTGSIGSEITPITPFSTWQVRLPKLSVNEGLDFGDNLTADIVLSFRIEALAERAMLRFCEKRGTPIRGLSHGETMSALRMLRSSNAGITRLRGAAVLADEEEPGSQATVDNMLSQMYKAQGVLKGWDCVLNLLEEPVNRFLEVQYKERYPTAKPMIVDILTCTGAPSPIPGFPGTIFSFTKISINLAQPLLQFQVNNANYVKVVQDIKGGTSQKGSKYVKEEDAKCPCPINVDDPDIKWEAEKPIDVTTKNPRVVGAVALGKVQGLVRPKLPDGSTGDAKSAHSVVLDFTKGSFIAQNLDIDTDNAELNKQLSYWFQTHDITYLINTVVFNDATTLKALQPSKFMLNVLETNSKKNVLQVFITTNGTQQSNLTINVNEPIPDGYHNSLMINTKIMFEDIFVESFNKGSSNLQVEKVAPDNDYTAWSARVKSGSVTGEATFENTSTSETRISAAGNSITWPLKGLTFERTKDLGLQLTYEAKKTVGFQHRDYRCYSAGGGYPVCSWESWSDYSVEVDVTLSGNYPLTVDEKHQEVQIASTPPDVKVTPPDLKPTGPCECNDNDLKIMVGKILKKQVPEKLKDSMAGIKFTPVSVFALYNLLFPAEDFIVMKQAYVPGDLVVLGTFSKYVPEE